MIYVKCSENPFRIHEEEDISIIMAFLGRVEQRLHDILSDTRGIIVPPVSKWILTGCDVNKDIEIDGIIDNLLCEITYLINTAQLVIHRFNKFANIYRFS